MTLDEPRVRDILRVFCRAPIPVGQLKLYHLLVNTPGEFDSATYRQATGHDQHEQMGVLGALGRRINGTRRETSPHDKVGIDLLLEQTWHEDRNGNTYRARPELREAVRQIPELVDRFRRPLGDIDVLGPLTVPAPTGLDLSPALPPPPAVEPPRSDEGPFQQLLDTLDADGLHFSSELIANILLALQTKRFIILTGISGTGKTRIAQALARRQTPRVSPELGNYEVVAVRPDWTDNRGLLGYFNPITGSYVTTPFLRLLLRATLELERAEAERREPVPFFVVLDEMNLARVEHYFSDFLSSVESNEPLVLHDEEFLNSHAERSTGETVAVPRRLEIPANLFFVGTVNVDESTYMFSPKVLDRAFTIELNEVDLAGYEGRSPRSSDLSLERWEGRLSPATCRRPVRDDWARFKSLAENQLQKHLVALHGILERTNRHFGYRVANEIARFVNLAVEQARDPERAGWIALDLAVLQKVLPKLHGTQQELEGVLEDLLMFALCGCDGDPARRDLSRWKYDHTLRALAPSDGETSDAPLTLERTALKLWRMRERLLTRGFASWIE